MPIVRLATTEDSTEVRLSAELLRHLGVAAGDFVHITLACEGILITACDSTLQKQLRIAWQVMDENREALQRLAEPWFVE